MNLCRGAFNVNCSTTREPADVLKDMLRTIEMNTISAKKLGKFGWRCQKNQVTFDMELT